MERSTKVLGKRKLFPSSSAMASLQLQGFTRRCSWIWPGLAKYLIAFYSRRKSLHSLRHLPPRLVMHAYCDRRWQRPVSWTSTTDLWCKSSPKGVTVAGARERVTHTDRWDLLRQIERNLSGATVISWVAKTWHRESRCSWAFIWRDDRYKSRITWSES